MYGMFYGATAFNADISAWDTSSSTEYVDLCVSATPITTNASTASATTATIEHFEPATASKFAQ